MIAYYVNNSIHQIPSFIYIARALGDVVVTNGPDTFRVLQTEYADVPSEYYPSIEGVRARLTELRPAALIEPDYTYRELALPFKTVHVQVFHGTSDKTYGLSSRIHDYDLLLLPGERSRTTMEQAGILTPTNYAVIGYPKADRVFRGELDRKDCAERLGVDPSRPTILYAPTWRDNKQNSSLPKFGAEVLSTAPDRYNLVVKLHPNTKNYDKRYYVKVEQMATANPRIKLLGFEHDVMPVMAAADLMLADISAVAHEFLCFDRPLVFLDPRIIPTGKNKTWVWRTGRVVKRRGLVWQAVAESLANPSEYARERQEARAEIYYRPDGHAAERAAEAVREYLAHGGH